MMTSPPRDETDAPGAEIAHVVTRFWRWQYGEFSPGGSWSPQINVYRLPDRMELCMELAGVDRPSIHVHVEPCRLAIRGRRSCPEPDHRPDEPIRIVCMEIDHGTFRREINLPPNVDLERVESVYSNGLLWIHLPLTEPDSTVR